MKISAVADHYQYIALIAVTALAAAAWYYWHRNARNPLLPANVAVLAVGALTFLAWQQSRLYADPIVLYEATLAHNPNSYFVHNNLGTELARSGRSQEAIDHFQRAIQLKPDYGLAHFNLAETLFSLGRAQEAVEHYQLAVKFQPDLMLRIIIWEMRCATRGTSRRRSNIIGALAACTGLRRMRISIWQLP